MLQDVHNMNPPAKFGYVKSEDKQYLVDERYHYKIVKAL